MKKPGLLTTREEELLNKLWEFNRPLTSNEMAKLLEGEGWNSVTLFKTVKSLSDAGYLEVVGLEKSVKAYARKLVPSMSKDVYYTQLLMKQGIRSDSLADITAAFIGSEGKARKERNADVIAKLEEVISELRNEEA